MDLKQLEEMGGLVSDCPVERLVKWTRKTDDGELTDEFNIHIIPMSYGKLERILGDLKTDNKDDERRSYNATVISECVLLNGGKQRITYEQAYRLKFELAAAIIRQVREVNGNPGKP